MAAADVIQQKFKEDEAGNVTIFSVFMLVLIIMITGASVDIMRFEATRAKMQSTMDRAVLAAADLDQKQDPAAVVDDYIAKAGMSDLLINRTVDDGGSYRIVHVDGDSQLDTIFLHMSGFDTLTAPAAATAEERISNVEVSLVLDISGSMRNNQRMDKMRPAAVNFVQKVMTNETDGVTTLNLVPFAGSVNPGGELFEYFRGERPKIKKNENNGWGNGDQDAPGDSLCNNNAENADEGAADPACATGENTNDGSNAGGYAWANGYFPEWHQDVENVVFYFDTSGDDVYDVAHKIKDFPSSASRDVDDMFEGAVAYLMSMHSDLIHAEQFLGVSVKGGLNKDSRYFQVKGDQNGSESDIGPVKNKGKIPGSTYTYNNIDFDYWQPAYVPPSTPPATEEEAEQVEAVAVNMPGSCIEIYDDEFATTNLPQSEVSIPHFMYWPIAADVMDWGWCPGEDSAIQYYSDDADHLSDFINDMRMHDGTGTHYGVKYALSLLDPATSDAVSYLIERGDIDGKFEGRPLQWDDSEAEKYIVVMTDGNTTQQYRPTDPDAAVNGYEALKDQGSGTYEEITSQSDNRGYLQEQCDLAKSLGVTVFTIAYETSDSASDDMLNCASSPSHFFRVDGDDIYDAFDIVARQINNLRLIQ